MKRSVACLAPVLLLLGVTLADVSGQSAVVKLDFDKVDPARMLIDP